MNIIKKKNILIGLVVVFFLFFVCLFLGLSVKPKINTVAIKKGVLIDYPTEFNYRQTKNDCGPFNVAAIVRALKGENVNSGSFAQEIGWRLPNKYTLPWGLESQLKEHGISIEKPNFGLLVDNEKIKRIQEYLSMGRPIVILGERDGYEHYITLFGFDSDKDQYYIYDSLQASLPEHESLTTDGNAFLPGNKTMKSQELIDFWRGGGMYGLWEWYGLVASL